MMNVAGRSEAYFSIVAVDFRRPRFWIIAKLA